MADPTAAAPVSRANLALGLGVATLLAFIAGMIFAGDSDENGWIWIVMAVFSVGAIVTGLMARQGGKLAGKALAGLVLGVIFLVLFLLFVTGILQ